MQISLENRQLWWKELRQLFPLVTLLLILAPIMLVTSQLMQSFFPGETDGIGSIISPAYFILGLPGIFAIGVGGILIGQEKEQKTIRWLSSLPIDTRKLINGKLFSGLVATGILWVICCPVALAIVPEGMSSSSRIQGILFWIAYSLFLLVWSLAINWRMKGAFSSLLAMVPIAILPSILFHFAEGAVNRWGGPNDSLMDTLCILILTFLAAIGWCLIHRFGQAALAPEKTAKVTFQDPSINHVSHYKPPNEIAGYYLPLSSMKALVWQALAQNGRLLAFLLVMLMTAGAFHVWAFEPLMPGFGPSLPRSNPKRESAEFCYVVYFLASSWLGVLAFQGDCLYRRILFLSDRGISPTMVWVTRHLPGISIILIFLSLFAIGLNWRLGVWNSIHVWLWVVPVFVACYSISQWVSQRISGLIASALIAPMVSWAFIMVGWVFIEYFGCPVWLVGLAWLIPCVATWWGTCQWMDQRSSVLNWFGHGFALVLMFVIPILPAWLEIIQTPRISKDVAAELQRVAQSTPDGPEVHFALTDPFSKSVDRKSSDSRSRASLIQMQSETISHLLKQLEKDSYPLMIRYSKIHYSQAPQFLMSFVEMSRLGWRSKTPSDESLQWYRESLRAIQLLAKRGRMSSKLIDHGTADQLEVFLLRELQVPEAQQNVGKELFQEIASGLNDRKSRLDARKRALAKSYVYCRQHRTLYSLGHLHYLVGYFSIYDLQQETNKFVADRRIGTVSEDLWNLLNSDPDRVDPQLVQRIASFWNVKPEDYRCLKQNSSGSQATMAPGSFWHGAWEKEAEELYRQSLQPLSSD